jgi:hypothetical protein
MQTKIVGIFIILLMGVCVFYGFRYNSLLDEKRRLLHDIDQLNVKIQVLENNVKIHKENEALMQLAHKQCTENMAKEKAKTANAPLKSRQPVKGKL